MNKPNERRHDSRRPLHEDVQIRVVDEKLEVIARCSNMSASGMLVQSPEMIKVGSKLSISLPNEAIGFDADGEVIRVVKDDKHFLIAIKLSDIKQ
ncbi:MAG: PilZ domain-containing protein [Pseudomonadales bacterium]|nr:PilZ domain-containing protein [Pseudomonadales bacterium]